MSRTPERPPEQQRALSAFVKLLRAAESVITVTHRGLVDDGLTAGQFAVLEVLYHRGPLCQRDIGRKILRSGGNTTTVLDNLERRGLVLRERTGADRRFVSVQLTAAGRTLIARVFPRHAAAITAALQVLTPDEQEELGRLCRKLGRQQHAPADD